MRIENEVRKLSWEIEKEPEKEFPFLCTLYQYAIKEEKNILSSPLSSTNDFAVHKNQAYAVLNPRKEKEKEAGFPKYE